MAAKKKTIIKKKTTAKKPNAASARANKRQAKAGDAGSFASFVSTPGLKEEVSAETGNGLKFKFKTSEVAPFITSPAFTKDTVVVKNLSRGDDASRAGGEGIDDGEVASDPSFHGVLIRVEALDDRHFRDQIKKLDLVDLNALMSNLEMARQVASDIVDDMTDAADCAHSGDGDDEGGMEKYAAPGDVTTHVVDTRATGEDARDVVETIANEKTALAEQIVALRTKRDGLTDQDEINKVDDEIEELEAKLKANSGPEDGDGDDDDGEYEEEDPPPNEELSLDDGDDGAGDHAHGDDG